ERLGCRAVGRRLALLPDDDSVDPAVWRHLRACPACRGGFAAFTAARAALRGVAARTDPGPEFFAALGRDTMRAVATLPPPRVRRRAVPWGRLSAAACVLAAAAGLWVASRPGRPGAALLQMPARPAAATAPAAAPHWIVPVSYTPSRQGLRGQLLSRDPFEPGTGR